MSRESSIAASPARPSPGRGRRLLLLWIVGLVPALAFAAITGQSWEDAFITLRHDVNLCEGNGLTYEAGSRIQGFSSPLSALIGGAAVAVRGCAIDSVSLGIVKAAGIAAYAGGFVFLILALNAGRRRSRGSGERASAPEESGAERPSLRSWARLSLLFPAGLYLLESKAVAFSANGMETGLLLLFTAAALAAIAEDGPPARRDARHDRAREDLRPSNDTRPGTLALGAAWAGMLWSRPDSLVAIGAMGLAVLAFPGGVSRRAQTVRLARSTGVSALLYAPWLVFATLTYGSPVPLTVVARIPTELWLTPDALVSRLARVPRVLGGVFLPPYAEFGDWSLFEPISLALAALACTAWLWPHVGLLGRRAGLVAACGTLYLALLPATAPWYFPATMLAMLPALGGVIGGIGGIGGIAGMAGIGRRGAAAGWTRPSWARWAAWVACGACLCVLAWLAIDTAGLARTTERVVESGNRREIGLWLAAHARRDETVFLECPGIIGAYSGMRVRDYPGLVSPAVVAARRRVGDNMAAVAVDVAADWLVLRPHEADDLKLASPDWLDDRYALRRVFDVGDDMRRRAPRHPEALWDTAFLVFQRRHPEGADQGTR